MKTVVIGATATIGRVVTELLQTERHPVVSVSSSRGELKVDIGSVESIRALLNHLGTFDGLISVAGAAYVGPLKHMGFEEFYKGIRN